MEIVIDKISKCNNCLTPTSKYMRYCSPCWKICKSWIPEQPRKGSTKSVQVPSVTADSGTNNITRIDLLQPGTTSTQISGIGSQTIKQELMETASPDLCTFCQKRPKNATFIHGNLGHQVCCYPCAKRCWKEKATCPVCKRKVEKIIKIIQA